MSDQALSSLLREAGSPFDASDADIVLRSVDGVDFRTYKSYLTRALHGFDDLLNAGHLNGIGDVEETQNGLLIVPLPESSTVLNLFLRTLYPVEFGCPALSAHLNAIPGVCKALSKYCVKNFPLSVKDALLLAADKEPEHVYAISCHYAVLSKVTKLAAKNTLRKPRHLDNLPDNVVADISSLQYHALAKYQLACRAAAANACKVDEMRNGPSDVPGTKSVRVNEFHQDCTCLRHWEYVQLQEVTGSPLDPDVEMFEVTITAWIAEYLDDVREDLVKGDRVCGDVAMKAKYLAKAIEAGRECPSCGKDVGKFIMFAQDVRQWIDDAIACIAFQGSALAA